MRSQTATELRLRIEEADATYGDFASVHEAVGVCSEEWDELRAAMHENSLSNIKSEYRCAETRLAMSVLEPTFRYGFRKNIITPWCDVPDTTRVAVKVKRSRVIGDWAMHEIRLIQRLMPQFNRVHCSKRRAA